MTHLILPGLYGSGPDHWQSWWLEERADAQLVGQRDWEHPRLEDWRGRVGTAVEAAPGSILIAHSLGCALVAHIARWRPELPIGGALLVAPADVDDASWTTTPIAAFAPMPLQTLPFPAIVVASHNDPYVRFERARLFAKRWGAEFINYGARGHINPENGFGAWPEGIALAERLETLPTPGYAARSVRPGV